MDQFDSQFKLGAAINKGPRTVTSKSTAGTTVDFVLAKHQNSLQEGVKALHNSQAYFHLRVHSPCLQRALSQSIKEYCQFAVQFFFQLKGTDAKDDIESKER